MIYLLNDAGAGEYGSPAKTDILTAPNWTGTIYLDIFLRGAGGGGGGGSWNRGGAGGGQGSATRFVLPIEPGATITVTLCTGGRGGDGNGAGVGAAGGSAGISTIDFGLNRLVQCGGGCGGQGGVGHPGPNYLDPYQGGRGGSIGASDEFYAWVLAIQAAGLVISQENVPAIFGQSSIGLIGGHGGGEGDTGGGGKGGDAPHDGMTAANGLSGEGAYRVARFFTLG